MEVFWSCSLRHTHDLGGPIGSGDRLNHRSNLELWTAQMTNSEETVIEQVTLNLASVATLPSDREITTRIEVSAPFSIGHVRQHRGS